MDGRDACGAGRAGRQLDLAQWLGGVVGGAPASNWTSAASRPIYSGGFWGWRRAVLTWQVS